MVWHKIRNWVDAVWEDHDYDFVSGLRSIRLELFVWSPALLLLVIINQIGGELNDDAKLWIVLLFLSSIAFTAYYVFLRWTKGVYRSDD